MRWLLLDEVLSIEENKARALSHVPDSEISAEPLLIEMMAQTGALVAGRANDFQEDFVFVKIDQAQFRRPPVPGEKLQIEAAWERPESQGGWIEATLHAHDGMLVSVRLLLMNVGRLVAEKSQPITFHRTFMDHFKIREKIK